MLQGIQALCQLVGREHEALHFAASGAEWAIVAVHLAGGGDHNLENFARPCGSRDVRNTFCKALRLVRDTMALLLGSVSNRLEAGRVAHLSESGDGIGTDLCEHVCSIQNMRSICQEGVM